MHDNDNDYNSINDLPKESSSQIVFDNIHNYAILKDHGLFDMSSFDKRPAPSNEKSMPSEKAPSKSKASYPGLMEIISEEIGLMGDEHKNQKKVYERRKSPEQPKKRGLNKDLDIVNQAIRNKKNCSPSTLKLKTTYPLFSYRNPESS